MKKIKQTVEMLQCNISNTKRNKKAFTLVELIIVISILAILATIAFTSFQNFTKDARDWNRITTLKNIESGLTLYNIKSNKYPDPEEYVEILSWNILLIKQWIVWNDVSQKIKLNKEAKDPKDKKNYIYSITWNGKKYQLWTYLEENKLTSYIPQITKTYANVGYSKRYFYTIWHKVWILLEDETNQVITWTWTLDLTDENNETKNFKVYFSNDTQSWSITSSWTNLIEKIVEKQNTTQTQTQSPANSCNATQPINATLTTWTPTSPNQAWQTTNSANPCHFVCNSWYWYNWSACVTATTCTTWIEYITIWTSPNIQSWSCKNEWATIVRDWSTKCVDWTACYSQYWWAWNYYQWGRTDTTWAGWSSDWWSTNNSWWWTTTTSSAWTYSSVSSGDQILMKWPCTLGYHVPTAYEWKIACDTISGTSCANNSTTVTNMQAKLRLPFAGYRNRNTGYYFNQSTYAYYWSSSPNTTNGYDLYFSTSYIHPANINYRAFGFSVRCIKN